MQWASRISVLPDLDRAIDEVCHGLRDELGGAADLIVAFASPSYGPGVTEVPERLVDELGGGALVGCTGGGIIGDGREVEAAPALSVTAARLPGVDCSAFHLGLDPDHWPAEVGVDPDAEVSFVLLPEPFSCDAQSLIGWFDAVYPDAVKVGGIASGGREPGGNALFADDSCFTGGAVGLALRGDIDVDPVVAQGCRPVGNPMFATSCDGNIILELDGHSAVQMIQDVFENLSDRDQTLFRTALFLGIVMRDTEESYEQGDFLVRNLAGIEPKRGALVVGARIRPNQVVQFHLRDAKTSAADLNAALWKDRAHRDEPPAGALLFSCLGRGEHLYGVPDHDSLMLREHYGDHIAVGGFFCNGEIGPVHGETFLHGYTSSFALFRPKSRERD